MYGVWMNGSEGVNECKYASPIHFVLARDHLRSLQSRSAQLVVSCAAPLGRPGQKASPGSVNLGHLEGIGSSRTFSSARVLPSTGIRLCLEVSRQTGW